MSYVALYRKYRPSGFDGVIGQDHIVKTLVNQINAGKVSHAYLFTGSRGTGKTSIAKIFAKAVNCTAPNGGSPCGKCEVCKALASESNIDIIEIDAASNNRVDEIREIRSAVKFLPVNGKYKVYIIDEVHMLTDSAFNALLKTLEEPPAHVIFVLATTEAHKLPATILSRCMRFDFRLVATEVLSNHLENIFKAEGKKAEKQAIDYIAALGEGSVRDMLSIADMCINYSDKKLTYAEVLSLLGATNKEIIGQLYDAIAQNNVGQILTIIDTLTSSGKSVNLIAKDVVRYCRDILAIKSSGENLIAASAETLENYREIAQKTSAEMLIICITELSKIDMELRHSISPRIVLEIACIRVGRLSGDDPFVALERIRRLEERLDSGEGVQMGVNIAPNSAQSQEKFSEKKTKNSDVKSQNDGTSFSENMQKNVSKSDSNNGAQNNSNMSGNSYGNARQSGDAFGAVSSLQDAFSDSKAVINNANHVATEVKKLTDARSVWGRLLTYFRKSGQMRIFTLLSEHKEYRVEDRTLYIDCGQDSYLLFVDDVVMGAMVEALLKDGCGMGLEVVKKNVGVDMDKEIARLNRLAPNVPIEILKK